MPTFVLKKYEPETVANPTEQTPAEGQTEQAVKKEEVIEFSANDSIAKIVAQALLKAVPNTEIEERVLAEQAERQKSEKEVGHVTAVSVEEINLDPVAAMRKISQDSCVVLIAPNGFHTSQENWFLETLKNRKVQTFYTVNSFVKHVKNKMATNHAG